MACSPPDAKHPKSGEELEDDGDGESPVVDEDDDELAGKASGKTGTVIGSIFPVCRDK